MGDAVHRDLVLLHDLQQGGLGLRAGAVDLVRQHHLAHHRALLELHLPGLDVDEGVARHIRGHQVGGELNAAEGTVQGLRQGAGQGGLAHARHVLDEDMALAQEGDQRIFDGLLLADDGLADVALQGLNHPPGLLLHT